MIAGFQSGIPLIKSIIVNVVMAQTMGITSANSACLTPFKYINTQINVPDATGHESLFEAEMHRCKHNLDMLLSVKGATLIVMDEIFSNILDVRNAGMAVLMVEQNAQQALNIADKGFVLVSGRNEHTGTGKELINDREVRKKFLGG